jgi:hypothetical protein
LDCLAVLSPCHVAQGTIKVTQHPIFWTNELCIDTSPPFAVRACSLATRCNDNFPFIQFGVEIKGKGLICDPGL